MLGPGYGQGRILTIEDSPKKEPSRLPLHVVDEYKFCITLGTLNYGSYGIFRILGNARFISSTVGGWGFGFGR